MSQNLLYLPEMCQYYLVKLNTCMIIFSLQWNWQKFFYLIDSEIMAFNMT